MQCHRALQQLGGIVLLAALSAARPAAALPLPVLLQLQARLRERDRLAEEAQKFRAAGKLGDAIAATERVVAIEREVFGGSSEKVADSLDELANLHEARPEFAAARRARQEVLVIQTNTHGTEHWRVTDARLALAHTDKLAALTAEERAQLERAKALDSEMMGLYRQGKYAEAAAREREALAIRKQILGNEHRDTASTLNNLAYMLTEQGDYTAARPLVEQALDLKKKILGPEHPGTATTLDNFGGLFYVQGDYAGARPFYEQALAIFKKALGPEHLETAICLNNLGGLLAAQRDYAGARPLIEQALAIRRKARGNEHPDTANSLNGLAMLLSAQGDYAGARKTYEQVLAIRLRTLGKDHPDTAISFDILGSLLSAQGDYAQARSYHEQALATLKSLAPEHPETAVVLKNLGKLSWAQADYAGARHHFENVLEIAAKNLALAAAAQSERQQLAMSRALRHQLDAYISLAPTAEVPGAQTYAPLLHWKGAVLARRQQAGTGTAPAVRELLRRHQSASSRLARLAFAVPGPQQQAAWRSRLSDLSQEKEGFERQLARASAAWRSRKAAQAVNPQQLQDALPLGTALLDLLEYTHWIPPTEGKGKWNGERHVAAFVIRPDQPIVQLDLGPLVPIEQAVDAWRKTLGRRGPKDKDNPAAELRRLVWEPLEPHLKDAATVLFSPDGALARLPFAALPGKDPDTYLLEERALAVVPVPQLLPHLLATRPPAPAPPSLLLVGDVDFGATPGVVADNSRRAAARGNRAGAWPAYRRLDATREEIVAIKDSFQRRFRKAPLTELRDDEPTVEAVRQQAPRHRYLHLATHGFFAPAELKSALAVSRTDDPAHLFGQQDVSGWHPGLLSGLVLAGANRTPEPGQDDGILTGLEVAALDLSGVELAVLSACETGLGDSAGGEGLLGLQRAFQVAGAKTVVASLWKVDDDATRKLMVRFYQNLWDPKEPLSKLEALREAQLWMLKEGVKRGLVPADEEKKSNQATRTPPRYWAGFVLSGDWR